MVHEPYLKKIDTFGVVKLDWFTHSLDLFTLGGNGCQTYCFRWQNAGRREYSFFVAGNRLRSASCNGISKIDTLFLHDYILSLSICIFWYRQVFAVYHRYRLYPMMVPPAAAFRSRLSMNIFRYLHPDAHVRTLCLYGTYFLCQNTVLRQSPS